MTRPVEARDGIRKFIKELLIEKGDATEFDDAEPLVFSGRLDSLAVVEIVVYLEDNHAIDFSDYPFDQSDFDTVNSILALIDSPLVDVEAGART